MLKSFLAAFGAVLCWSSAAAGTPSPPSLKPPVVYASKIVSTQDAAVVREAIRAGDGRNWSRLRQLRDLARDESVEDFVLWHLALAGDTYVGFDTLNEALARLSDWPRASQIRYSAEAAIAISALSPQARVDWFGSIGGAVTGDGKAALAGALLETGDRPAAVGIARDAWRGNTLSEETERALASRFGTDFTQDDHRARMDFLLWTSQRSAAGRMRPRLTADHLALADARMALKWGGRNVDAEVDAVPASLQEHPGLLFERARWRRVRGRNQAGATELLVRIDGSEVPEAGRDNLWEERNIALRDALKNKDYRTAYRLAAPHGMSEGAGFADAEWIAGWIALRFLGEPEKAAQHFQTMRAGVTTAISASRGDYWNGRALDAMGQPEAAQAAYRLAAIHSTAYYGQLAAEKAGQSSIILPPTAMPSDEERAAFLSRPLIVALRLLGEAGERGLFRQFAYHVDDLLETPAEQVMLAEIANEYHLPDVGVRGGKAGLGKGIIAPEAAYPVISFPLQRSVNVETALVLALSRQESELNPRAISHANARGLMQLIPATARTQARREGLPYRTSWLTDDPGYNMTLGASHLDDLLDMFEGSYIMTAAAYNAGPRRPKQWVIDYGDPRDGEVDPVDWVELVPFSETRNYIQRILENVQVYRHRLTGEPAEIRISQDLARGRR